MDLPVGAGWVFAKEAAHNHASSLARFCTPDAAELIRAETRKFCGQQAPTSPAELEARNQESLHLLSKIGTVSHVDQMARQHPKIAGQLMQLLGVP